MGNAFLIMENFDFVQDVDCQHYNRCCQYGHGLAWRLCAEPLDYSPCNLDLLHVRETGVFRGDRTGTGTQSVFGYQMGLTLAQGSPFSPLRNCI